MRVYIYIWLYLSHPYRYSPTTPPYVILTLLFSLCCKIKEIKEKPEPVRNFVRPGRNGKQRMESEKLEIIIIKGRSNEKRLKK